MSIQFRCSCGQTLAAKDGSAGKKAKCPKCGKLSTIPSPTPKAQATSPSSAQVLPKPVQSPVKAVARPVAAKPVTAQSVSAQPITKPIKASVAGQKKPAAQSKPPATPDFQESEPDPLSVELPAPAFDPFSAPALNQKKKKKNSSSASLWPKVAIGFASIAGTVLVGFFIWQFLPTSGGSGELESSFKPLSISPDQPNGPGSASGSLKIAQEFISFAQRNDASSALKLIDRDEFRKRVRSKYGSYEAMRNRISVDELLDNLDNYSLEKVAADNGRRKWQILGTSRFRGEEGTVVRYYVEGKPASEVFRNRDRLLQIVELLELEQFMNNAQHIFAAQDVSHTQHDSYRLSSHAINSVNPARVGYLLLITKDVSGQDKLVDIVNILGQTPYSQTCGKVYLDDYHIYGLRGETEDFGTEAIQLSIFGASPLTGGFSAPAGDQEAWDRAKAEADAKTARVNNERPKRLEKINSLLSQSTVELSAASDSYRQDFPGDLGIELATVVHCLQPADPYCNDFVSPKLVEASRKLYETWQDPFLIYCEAVAAWKTDNRELAERQFLASRAAGFETADLHAFLIDQALRNSDRQQLLTALANFDEYCKSFGQSNDASLVQTFQSRWDSCYQQLHPQPTVADKMSEQAQKFAGGRRGRAGGFPFSNRPGGGPGRNPSFGNDDELFGQGMGSSAGAGNQTGAPDTGSIGSGPPSRGGFGNRPSGSRGGFGNRGGTSGRGGFPGGFSPPGDTVAQKDKVTIKIVAASAFDINKMFQDLRKQLSVAGGSCSRSNNRGQIVLHYSGQVENVAKAIGFGTIKATDKDNRVIEVALDQ